MNTLYKELTTVYHFPDGRTATATFCLEVEPKDGHEANSEIMRAQAEYAQEQFTLGAVKAVTTARFVGGNSGNP